MRFRPARLAAAVTLAAGLMASTGAVAASCGNGPAGFSAWLADFKREAAGAGISAGPLAALNGVTYDTKVIALDRHQGHFNFSISRATPLIGPGAGRVRSNAALLKRIEARFGVPGSVVVAIWGLETGFGANNGNMPVIRSLATLAYDCRRSAFFANELMSALRLIQRGDLSAAAMRGAWAGELGQTQFLPSSYVKFAVDFDGNGRRDLIHSSADALASTANYLKGYGWRAGQPFSEGTANFQVLLQWNKAQIYVKTVAYLAEKIGGG